MGRVHPLYFSILLALLNIISLELIIKAFWNFNRQQNEAHSLQNRLAECPWNISHYYPLLIASS